jgi:hypothetical protein
MSSCRDGQSARELARNRKNLADSSKIPKRPSGPTSGNPMMSPGGNPMMSNVRGDTWAQKKQCLVASHHKVADPPPSTHSTRGMFRLEDMQNALNGCCFCAGCGIRMAFSVRRRAIVVAFLGSLACKIEKTKNPNCDAYHLRVSIFAVKVELHRLV